MRDSLRHRQIRGRKEQEQEQNRNKHHWEGHQVSNSAHSESEQFSSRPAARSHINRLSNRARQSNPACETFLETGNQQCGPRRLLWHDTQNRQNKTKQGTLPTHCFLLECPPSNISQVVKPTAKAKRCQPRLWVLLAWKPSLRWNESCCTGAKVQTSSPVAVPHGWLYAQLSMVV